MKTKELLQAFEAASWETPAEMDGWLRAAGNVPAGDLEKCLEILEENALGDPVRADRRRRAFLPLVERSPSKELFVPFVAALSRGNPEARAVVLALLPKVNELSAHDELCALFRSEEPDVRRAAADAVRKVGSGPTFQRLLQLLQGPDLAVRAEALEAAVALGGAKALPAVVATLRSGKTTDRVRAIGYLGSPELVSQNPAGAKETLRGLFGDPADEVVVAAIDAFGRIGNEDEYFRFVVPGIGSPRIELVEVIVRGLARYPTPRAVDQLEKKIAEGPARVRLVALDALAEIGGALVVPVVSEALGHPQISVRNRAADVLVGIAQSGGVDLRRTVQWLLRSNDANVRRLAMHVAAHLVDEDEQLWPHLLAGLRDNDWWVRERTIDALVALAGERVQAQVTQLLSDPSPLARMYALAVLERLSSPDAREMIRVVARSDDDALVRERAVEAMATAGDRSAEKLLVDLLEADDEIELACLEALEVVGGRDAVSAVARCLQNPDPDVRLAALSCLERFDDPSALEAVRAAAGDGDARVQATSRALVRRWLKRPRALPNGPRLGTLDDLLERAVGLGADQVLLAAGARPMGKQGRQTGILADVIVSGEQVQELVMPLLEPRQRERLEGMEQVEVAFALRSSGRRFRATVFPQHKGLTVRFTPSSPHVPSLDELGLPAAIETLTEHKNGLVLLAGGQKSGKTSALNALVRRIAERSTRHIVLLESGSGAVHRAPRSVVTQREIGSHAPTLSGALRAALREDADVIAIDDVSDLEAMSFVVTAAETGHLLIAAIAATSCQQAIDKLIASFPEGQREHVRAMIATSLRGAICMRLLRRADGKGLVPATEVLLSTSAVSNLIRKGKTVQLSSVIAMSVGAGMHSFSADVQRLLRAGAVDPAGLFPGA